VKRLLIILSLAAIVAIPFAVRPRRPEAGRAADTLVVVTPNNEAIRHEFGIGFESWYQRTTGRSIAIDWRVLGGTSEIARYLEGEYAASFRNYWTGGLGRPWSLAVEQGFQRDPLSGEASPQAAEAREAFLHSDVGCGIDVFFGGGTYDFEQQALAGRLVPSGVVSRHPDWFNDGVIALEFDGEPYRDPQARWLGSVISAYGIIYNRDALRRLGIGREPSRWSDLADPRLFGQVALCDPTKSGSIATAFENVIQQEIHRRLRDLEAARKDSGAPGSRPDDGALEARAVREGWMAGLRLLQEIGANARYFTDASQKPPIDVADGDCAAGMCIDFYGNQQQEALRRRGDWGRVGFVSPPGGTAYSVDPVAILRGARNRAAAEAFMDYALSMEGQKLWAFKPGAPGGPAEFALRRLPIRRDFYAHDEWKALRSDPEAAPYAQADPLVYRAEWTDPLFREMAFIIRVMCQDTHDELTDAWRAILRAKSPVREEALAELQDLSLVSYDRARGEISEALGSKDQVDEVRLASRLAAEFRARYSRAEKLAEGK